MQYEAEERDIVRLMEKYGELQSDLCTRGRGRRTATAAVRHPVRLLALLYVPR